MENTDNRNAPALLVPEMCEDSVDIYDDLDMGCSTDAGKSPQGTSELRESMDLYEEIVTEEQRNRESSHADLKFRFQAAQKQIIELRRRLEEMELKNTKLNAENHSLKKNISALFRTAKQEMTRKDAEIQRLNQWSVKGHHLQDPNISRSRPPTSSPLPPSSSHLPSSTPASREFLSPQNPLQLSKKESSNSSNQPTACCTEARASKKAPDCHLKSSSTLHSDLDKHKSRQIGETYPYPSPKPSESDDRRQSTRLDSKMDHPIPDKARSYKKDKDTGQKYDSRTSTSKTALNTEEYHKLHKATSPLGGILDSTGTTRKSQKLREVRDKHSTLDSDHIKTTSSRGSNSHDSRNSHRHHRSSRSKDRKHSSSHKSGDRHRDFSKEGGEQPLKDYLRKVERRHEVEVNGKHKRNSLLETSREQEKSQRQRTKELGKGDVNVCEKEKQKKKHVTSEKKSNRHTSTKKGSMEDNTPNQKLCFMETLNLTLSPIKKPSSHMDDLTVEKGVEIESYKETSQPDIEGMCVIDEVGSSQLEDIVEQTSDIPEDTAKSCESVKDVQKEDTSCTEAKGRLKDDSVEAKMSSVTVQSQMHINSTPKSPPSFEEQNHYKSVMLMPEKHVNESGPVEAAISPTNKLDTNSCSSDRNRNLLNVYHPLPIIDQLEPESKENPLPAKVETSFPVNSVKHDLTSSPSKKILSAVDVSCSPKSQHLTPTVLLQNCEKESSPPALYCSINKKNKNDGNLQDEAKDTEVVTSTINLESLPQEGLSLPEAIYILTQTTDDASDSTANKPDSLTPCVTSTTEEYVLSKRYCEPVTPKKTFSPLKGHESSVEPSSSVPLLHDEDSMMHTLRNLKRFPNAISPLQSPVRINKRSPLHVHVKPGHAKSLQPDNDFSDTAVDDNKKKLDVNKENKYPGSPANGDIQNMVDNATDHLSSVSDKELEEGEILSDGEEATPDSPSPATKLAKLSPTVRTKSNYKTVLKRKSEECHLISKEAPGTSTRSPKRRFKMVCPAATKVYFSNIDEIMETFQLVRSEIRKKYMKLHKTFPRKSFYGMMDNFQESFLEFVDGAQFGQICSEAEKLKCRLKKLIASVFGKVSNNGIVKRIFEQQATDLKQKLWDFVDVQVDYLFKEIQTTLKSLCKPASTQAEPSVEKGFQPTATGLSQSKTSNTMPYRTGLGSRGKDIRITHVENATHAESQNTQMETLASKKTPPTPDKNNMVSLMVSQNGSLLDKTDFDILTEQQASSLTFNLVRDSQMGEIFKCLLQGSDLLESCDMAEDGTAWPLTTPRKVGERLISITTPTKFDSPSKLLSPNKFDTPSKLISTWSTISPRKMLSPRAKDAVALNPALFDESCLLEVPAENRMLLQSGISSQKSHSILAEDLAVSLSLPSPLKSDSHLSFLQPFSMHIISTPCSVISAHISEDALLEGEDATEQEIHLSLDTDNSSCSSISSINSGACATSLLLQPDQPMQALVMEKSNDHFIVKIRQAPLANATPTANSLSATFGEEAMSPKLSKESKENTPNTSCSPSDAVPSVLPDCAEPSSIALTQEKSVTPTKHPSCQNKATRTQQDLKTEERSLVIAEVVNRTPETHKGRKRKRCREKTKAKRCRKEEEEEERTDKEFPGSYSPNSISARNVVRKKGEVVIAWTRDEDRAILIYLKKKGPSRETFSYLSTKLKKPSSQIAHRFYQLMKLFKKQEKSDA